MITGGTAPILYNIDGGANQASNVFNGLATGTYTIGIEDALGCTASTSVTIIMAATLTIDNITKNDVTCMAQGDVTITVSGGTAPLEYSIDNGVSYQGSNFFGGLSAGTYDVVVRDANLCTDNSTVTIDPGTSPTIDNVARTDETCAALGSISLTASGGTPPLTYSLDNGATFFSTTNFENLSAGNYTVMVMDAIGCMDNRSVAIDPPANIVIDSVVVIDDSCSACQGEATIYASGPSPFNYSIDNNATSQASNVFTNLCSGALNIVVSTGSCSTNGNGTVANLGTVADATISGPGTVCVTQGDIVLSAATPGGVWSGTGVNPVTGVFNTQSSGPGSFTLTYTLGGACGNTDNITLTVTDTVDPGIDPVSAQCELGSPVSLTASESGGVWSGVGVSGNEFDPANAGAGTHTIYYTLTGVCSEVDSTEVTVENKIDPNISPVNPLCITQSPVNLTTAVSGGTWSGSVVSASGLFDPSTAGAGTHTVYYTLPGACTNNDSINIAVIDTTRPSIDPVSPLCVTGGSVSLTGSTPGGSWSGIGVNGNQFDPQTAGPGTHYVLYTISGTCTDTAGMSISVTDTLNPGIHPVDPVCVIGSPVSLTANIGGGTWSGNGVSDHHETFNPQTAGAGTHKVYYTVTGICVDRDSINIAVSDTITPAIDPVSTQCTGNAAFQLTTSIPGGTWSGNGITHASNGTFDPAIAQAGTHTITYTINIGACTSSPSIDIDVFDSQDATIAPAGPFCSVDSPTLLTAVDGAGIWSGTGVTASTGSFDPATAGAGTHEIIYTIAGICGDADTIMVEVIQQPDASITAVPIQCIGGKPVQLTAATTEGIWGGNGVDSTGVFTPVVSGNFVVTYSIPGFCGNFDQITVVVEENPIIEVKSTINNVCSGAEVSLSYISTVPLSNCSWDFGDGTTAASCEDVTHAYTQIGCYDVIISGDSPAGCRAKKEATDLVCIHPDPVAAFESDKDSVKTSYTKVSFTNLSENAITYVWDFAGEGSSTMEHPSYTFPSEAGVYNVCLEATSQYGCTDVVCHEVYVEEDQYISVPNAFTPNGDGLNDKFVPIIMGFGETSTYQMQIWNRWGELIFETDNLKEYWDGTVGGNEPITNTYVWKMFIYDSDGNSHDFIGHVTILR